MNLCTFISKSPWAWNLKIHATKLGQRMLENRGKQVRQVKNCTCKFNPRPVSIHCDKGTLIAISLWNRNLNTRSEPFFYVAKTVVPTYLLVYKRGSRLAPPDEATRIKSPAFRIVRTVTIPGRCLAFAQQNASLMQLVHRAVTLCGRSDSDYESWWQWWLLNSSV